MTSPFWGHGLPKWRKVRFFWRRNWCLEQMGSGKESYKVGPYQILGGGFNPFEKYDRQIGSFPQVGVKIEHI